MVQNQNISSLHLSLFSPKMEIILKTGQNYCEVKCTASKIYWVLSFEDDVWLRTRWSLLLHHCKKGWRSVLDPAFIGYVTLRRSPAPTRQPHIPPPWRGATIKPILWGYLSRRICQRVWLSIENGIFFFFFVERFSEIYLHTTTTKLTAWSVLCTLFSTFIQKSATI